MKTFSLKHLWVYSGMSGGQYHRIARIFAERFSAEGEERKLKFETLCGMEFDFSLNTNCSLNMPTETFAACRLCRDLSR